MTGASWQAKLVSPTCFKKSKTLQSRGAIPSFPRQPKATAGPDKSKQKQKRIEWRPSRSRKHSVRRHVTDPRAPHPWHRPIPPRRPIAAVHGLLPLPVRCQSPHSRVAHTQTKTHPEKKRFKIVKKRSEPGRPSPFLI
jgi:hypothetical protein